MKPYSDKVLILPDEQEKETKSGLSIPDKQLERPMRGTIVAVGPGRPGLEMQSKVGDRVVFSKNSFVKVVEDGKEYLTGSEGFIFYSI